MSAAEMTDKLGLNNMSKRQWYHFISTKKLKLIQSSVLKIIFICLATATFAREGPTGIIASLRLCLFREGLSRGRSLCVVCAVSVVLGARILAPAAHGFGANTSSLTCRGNNHLNNKRQDAILLQHAVRQSKTHSLIRLSYSYLQTT